MKTNQRLRLDRRPNMGPITTIELPDHWSTDQAVAVFEVLGAVREHLFNIYGMDVLGELQLQESVPNIPRRINADKDSPR